MSDGKKRGGRRQKGKMTKERLARLSKVEDMILRGVTSHREIAARLGISESMASLDIKALRERWDEDNPTKRYKRNLRINQLSKIAVSAWAGFERSQQNAEQVTVKTEKHKCRPCDGEGLVADEDTGELTDEWCENCNGNGWVPQDVETCVMKGQAGDPSFLKVALNAVQEISKLEGLYPSSKVKAKVDQSGAILHAVIPGGQAGDSDNEFMNAPAAVLINARTALEQLNESVNGKPKRVRNKSDGEEA